MATKSNGKAAKAAGKSRAGNGRVQAANPLFPQKGKEIQPFGTVRNMPIALSEEARLESCEALNQILADSTILFSMYKKHHWQVAGHTFYQLHLLFDKHAEEQLELIDLIAERVQALGGLAVGDPRHAAEITKIERPPDGAEEVPVMISRLLAAHEVIIGEVREAIDLTDENGDKASSDMLAGDVLAVHEKQVWFDAEHLVDVGVVRAE